MKPWLALFALALPALASAQDDVTYLPKEDEGPRLLELSAFPTTVSGFTLGLSAEAYAGRCRKGGQTPFLPKDRSFVACDDGVEPKVFDGRVTAFFCGKKTCEHVVSFAKSEVRDMQIARHLLVSKYGSPHTRYKTYAEVLTACTKAPLRDAYADEAWWFGPEGARTARIQLEYSCETMDNIRYPQIRVRYDNLDGLRRKLKQTQDRQNSY